MKWVREGGLLGDTVDIGHCVWLGLQRDVIINYRVTRGKSVAIGIIIHKVIQVKE